jgi:hypothetical protein
MQVSKRHHYLPQFFLKRFTNPEGKFYIWLTKKKRFKDNGKLFYPKSHFFEIHGNSVTYDNIKSDFVEKEFSNIDDRVSKFYRKLDSLDNDYVLEDDEWQMLQYFINSMYWRLPCNEEYVKSYIQRAATLGHFGITLKSTITNEAVGAQEQHEFLLRVKADAEFRKFLKINMPAFTYHHRLMREEKDIVHIINFPYQLPRLISDNPIILRNPGTVSPHLDEMVFPLTPNKLLFRNNFTKMITHSYVRVMIDAMMLAQSKEFVAVTDKIYPDLLLKTYASEYGEIEALRESIFLNVGERGEDLPIYKKYGAEIT